MKTFGAVVFAVLFSLTVSCSGDTGSSDAGASTGGGNSQEESDTFEEGTLGPTTRGPETTRESPPEAILGPEPDTPAVLLRIEGDPGTTFSGICTVGGKESVLSGRIPKRYAFDPRGQNLSCRIEKQGSRGGALKVILIAGDTTRSVQQTNAAGGVINISYEAN
jgi:hypothetical protein